MRRILNMFLLVGVVTAAGAAIAQDEETIPAAEEATQEDVSGMSDDQMLSKTETTLVKLRDIRKYVQNLLDQARKAKDIIKVTCLNDKLTQINVNIRTYEDRMQSLKNAIQIGDRSSRNHEYNVLTVLENKIIGLRMEAETCIGEAEGYLGKTEVTVTTPKGMAEMDPTRVPDIGIEIIDRPPPASAFQ
jgi:hypothetical protein